MFDILIENGRVVDGTGSPWYRAAIGIREGVVTVLREDTSSCDATERIDVSGQVVCPAFIDSHAHSDLAVLARPRNENKVNQGIGSEINGNCGIGYVPLSHDRRLSMSRFYCGVTGTRATEANWESVSDYLAAIDGHVATNQGYLVPHGCLRLETVGWNNRPATQTEIQTMKRLLRASLEEGALGMSTGLTYPPGMWAHTDELVELCQVVREMGGVYASHVRYTLGDGILDGFREAISIASRSGCALQISHFYVPGALRGSPEKMLSLIDSARARGIDVTFDAYTYEYGSSTLASVLPAWALVGGPDALLQRLRDEETRKQLRNGSCFKWPPDKMLIASTVAAEDKQYEGVMLSEVSKATGQTPLDAVIDMLVRNELEVSFTVETGNLDDIAAFVAHEAYMVGTDALLVEGHSNPRTYGTCPRLLGMLVRDQHRVSLESAIHKMTCVPARRFGLSGRGILCDGAMADVVVFDPLSIGASGTLSQPDLEPVGIEHVFVNGKAVLKNGRGTEQTPGIALRRNETIETRKV